MDAVAGKSTPPASAGVPTVRALARLPAPSNDQRGAALLLMLALLLTVLTTATITRFSINRLAIERNEATAIVLDLAKQNLLGYALRHNVAGTLPCPDTDPVPDGLENVNASGCVAQIGRLPYRTLALDELRDTSGTPLWYAVAPAYTHTQPLPRRNSSITTHYMLDGQPVAAVIIAPGAALPGQQRNNMAIGNYLEGENANASIDTYARLLDDLHNDQLLGIGAGSFWTLMEKRILQEAGQLLRAYENACGQFPWAGAFTAGSDDSIALQQAGAAPLGTALPANWNSGCASGLAPTAALSDHWRDQLYFRFCTPVQGQCNAIAGDNPAAVRAVLVAPGVPLVGQNRAAGNLNDYYEDANATPDSNFQSLLPRHFDDTFNDTLYVVEP